MEKFSLVIEKFFTLDQSIPGFVEAICSFLLRVVPPGLTVSADNDMSSQARADLAWLDLAWLES